MGYLDEATSEDTTACFYLQRFLESLENLGNFWEHLGVIDKQGFLY
jgi:hypothetical protein